MALWHFLKNGIGYAWEEDGELVSSFDDGLTASPGDADFSSELANEKAASLGKGIIAEYTGTPNRYQDSD